MRAVKGNLATPPDRDEKNEARLDQREQLGEERVESLLCSRNARPPKALIERAQWKIINQPPFLKRKQASVTIRPNTGEEE